jgi:hypothetical protein
LRRSTLWSCAAKCAPTTTSLQRAGARMSSSKARPAPLRCGGGRGWRGSSQRRGALLLLLLT